MNRTKVIIAASANFKFDFEMYLYTTLPQRGSEKQVQIQVQADEADQDVQGSETCPLLQVQYRTCMYGPRLWILGSWMASVALLHERGDLTPG